MKKQLLLPELIHTLDQELLRLGYSNSSMKIYRRRWRSLIQFAEERGELFYSEQLGIDFVEKHFNVLEKYDNRGLSESDVRELRIIRMIGDFQLHHSILRRYKNKEIMAEPSFIALRNQLQLYCEGKGFSKATTSDIVNHTTLFMHYLTSQNVTDCRNISLPVIHAYIKTLHGYANATIRHKIFCLRKFFGFLLETGEVQTDLAVKTLIVQIRKQTSIPCVWTKDEIQKLIAAIDRGSPKGKRDYAIILLACRLGMRGCDIRNLKKVDFHWEDKKLIFIQSKTKTPLSLPLTPEVGWAIIDYLKYGRPNIDTPYIFVRHIAPFDPLAEGVNLNDLIKAYIVLARLPSKNRRGLHSLRHTMASMLLEKDTPLSTISGILGHVDTNSTAVYLKVGIKKLRECALTLEGDHNHD